MGRSLERVHHGCGHLRRAHHVGDRHAVPTRGTGMDRANVVPRKVRRPPMRIDHRQLTPTMMGCGRYQGVDRLLGAETEVEEREPERAEARIRPMLGQHRTDPGAGKLAAIADGDGGCGDDGAEHACTRAAPSRSRSWGGPPRRMAPLSVSCEALPVQGASRREEMSRERDRILRWIDEDRENLIGFLSRFVRVPSPNPPGDTRAAAAFLHDALAAQGVPVSYRTAKPEWPNVVGTFDAHGTGPHLVLNGHIDVFPPGPAQAWSRDPWSGAVADGKVHGRGVVDMKCGTAASVWTYIYLHRLREELAGRLTLTCVSDEETGGTWGAKWLIDTFPDEFRGDCVLNAEPSTPGMVRFGSSSPSTRPGRTGPTPTSPRTPSRSQAT